MLRSHVRRCSDGNADAGQSLGVAARGDAERLGDAEVREQRVLAAQQDVFRLDVAMYDAFGVGERNRFGDVTQDADGVLQGHLTRAVELPAECFALHQRHRIPGQTVDLARREERNDMRVVQTSGDDDLALEAFDRSGRHRVNRKKLDDDTTAEGRFLGDEDARHRTAAELALDRVRAAEAGLK